VACRPGCHAKPGGVAAAVTHGPGRRNMLSEGELDAEAVVKQSLTTAADGKSYNTALYSLNMILAIGYRVLISSGDGK